LGAVLSIRAKSGSSSLVRPSTFELRGADGGNCGETMPKMWISTTPGGDPLSGRGSSDTSGSIVRIIVGPGYADITPNKMYYINIMTTRSSIHDHSPRFQFSMANGFGVYNQPQTSASNTGGYAIATVIRSGELLG
jgi:hypothetical protein